MGDNLVHAYIFFSFVQDKHLKFPATITYECMDVRTSELMRHLCVETIGQPLLTYTIDHGIYLRIEMRREHRISKKMTRSWRAQQKNKDGKTRGA
jgi:hypothetical protein